MSETNNTTSAEQRPPEQRTGAWTPGPWLYFLDSEGYYAIAHTSDAHEPGDVAHVYIPGAVDPKDDDHNEGLANARLISAAPLLAEALERTMAVNAATAAWLEGEDFACAANVPDSGIADECDHCAVAGMIAEAGAAIQAAGAALAAARPPAEEPGS